MSYRIVGMDPTALLDHLRQEMRAVSLVKLSAVCGISTRQLERIRAGRNSPSVATLQAIADGLRTLTATTEGSPPGSAAATEPTAPARRRARATATSASGVDTERVGHGA